MTITEREELISKTVARLQSIKTLKEYKASKDEIMDLMEKVFRSAIDVLKDLFENMLSLTPEEQKAISEKCQDDNFLLSPDIMKEFDRLEKIPGATKFSNSFSAEMQERMSPYLDEFAKQMGKLMENFMGGLMGGIAEAMGTVAGSGTGGEETQEAEQFVYDEQNPDTPFTMYPLYSSRSLADLENNKDWLIGSVEEELTSGIDLLRLLAEDNFKNMFEGDAEKIAKTRNLLERLNPEIDREFARIAALPGAAKSAGEIRKELMDHITPKMKEAKGLLPKE